MPIYAYQCRACGHGFSTLVRSDETPECPSCASVDLERQLSLVAAPPRAGGDPVSAPCGVGMGACGAAACGCPAFAD